MRESEKREREGGVGRCGDGGVSRRTRPPCCLPGACVWRTRLCQIDNPPKSGRTRGRPQRLPSHPRLCHPVALLGKATVEDVHCGVAMEMPTTIACS